MEHCRWAWRRYDPANPLPPTVFPESAATDKDRPVVDPKPRLPISDPIISTSFIYWTAEEDVTAENEGDGTKGSYVTTDERSGNLEVRLAPYWKKWQDGDFEVEHGFNLQPGLADHIGDRLHMYGVDSGELIVKATALVPDDYMQRYDWMTVETFADWPYAGLDILSSYISPDKLAEIWPQIQTGPKKINMVNKAAE